MLHPAAALGNEFFGEECHQRCSAGCHYDAHHWQWYSHSRPNEVGKGFETLQNAFQGNRCTHRPLKPFYAFESIQKHRCLLHP